MHGYSAPVYFEWFWFGLWQVLWLHFQWQHVHRYIIYNLFPSSPRSVSLLLPFLLRLHLYLLRLQGHHAPVTLLLNHVYLTVYTLGHL